MARVFLPCLLLLVAAQTALSSGVFELRIDSFTASSSVCPHRSVECRVFFRVCLKHSQNNINPEPPCTYGTGITEFVGFDSNSITETTSMTVPFQFKWPGAFSLIIEAWNAVTSGGEPTENQNNLISRLAARRSLTVSEDWSQDVHFGNQSVLRFSYHVVCNEYYHGEACSAYCRPRNDTFGHYTCDKDGNRSCLEGWTGEYCTDPICAPGCSTEHGFCESPGECVCRQGWQGERCDECARHPGCLHGTCQQPWQCNCKEGWGGLYCDQDLNYCTNHKPCRNGASCTNTGEGSYTCACRPGYTGKDCEIKTSACDSNPCRNGGSCSDLVNDYSCTCSPGFHGRNCESTTMRCAEGLCFNGGTCIQEGTGGFSCRCPSNFTGSNCERKIDRCSSSPCTNGAQCLDLGNDVVCRCQPGFTGSRCETNVDDCACNPCRNGGTCFDSINNYTCACTLGFSGRDCTVRSSLCDQFSCKNGGTCFTHFTGPVCQCPPDFMGARCEYPILRPTVKPPPNGDAPAAVIAAIALGILTFLMLVCAAIFFLRQLRRGRELRALSTSVKNDLESVNNRNAVIGGGPPNNGGLVGAPLYSLKEKEAFLLPGNHFKISNRDVALAEKGSDNIALFKNKMADYNLAKEEQPLDKNKFDLKKCDPSVIVPPLPFAKENLYHSVFIIPEQMEQCVFATEV